MQLVALQRDEHLRATYKIDVSLYSLIFIDETGCDRRDSLRRHQLYSQKCLIFIDETGCDKRDPLRRHGYTMRGKRLQCHKLLVRGKRISVIAAMSVESVLCLKLVHDTVTGNIFLDFIRRELLPNLMTINGTNPNSVVILDNCSVYHVSGVADII